MSDRSAAEAALLEMRRMIVSSVLMQREKRLTRRALHDLTLEADLADYQPSRIQPEALKKRSRLRALMRRLVKWLRLS